MKGAAKMDDRFSCEDDRIVARMIALVARAGALQRKLGTIL